MKYIITSKQYKLLKEQEQEILHIPSIDLFGGWYNLQKFLKRRGNPPYSIGANLDLANTQIESLGNLTSVGGYLNLFRTSIESLGNLTSVGGNLSLRLTPIKSLGNLTSVGGYLDLFNTPIKSLGNLTSVGGTLNLEYTPIARKYIEKQIRSMVFVAKEIHL